MTGTSTKKITPTVQATTGVPAAGENKEGDKGREKSSVGTPTFETTKKGEDALKDLPHMSQLIPPKNPISNIPPTPRSTPPVHPNTGATKSPVKSKEYAAYKRCIEQITVAFDAKKKAIPSTRRTILSNWATELNKLVTILTTTSDTKVLEAFLEFVDANRRPGKCLHSDEVFSYVSRQFPATQVDKIAVTITSFVALAEFYEKKAINKAAVFRIDTERIAAITGSETIAGYLTTD